MAVLIDLSGTTIINNISVSIAVVAGRITKQPSSSTPSITIGVFFVTLHHAWWFVRDYLHVFMLYLCTPCENRELITLLEPQSRFGDQPLKFQVVCPQNGTAVLKG